MLCRLSRLGLASLCLWLTACLPTGPSQGTGLTPVSPATPFEGQPADLPAAATPLPSVPESATPVSASRSLTIWLPPQFDPARDAPASRVLAAQIQAFEQIYPDTRVRVRLKADSGPGSLLRALVTAYNAAPDVLPDLVALNRDDLEAAAAAGLLQPLDDVVPAEVVADYFPFAQAMVRQRAGLMGLPFTAEVGVLVYRTDVYPTPPHAWSEVITGTLVMPLGDTAGLAVLQEYLAQGGPLTDPSGRVVLDTEILTQALAEFQSLQINGPLPASSLAYTDTLATWQVFRERRASLAVVSASQFLAERSRVSQSAVSWIPSAQGQAFGLAEGWSWALVNTTAGRQAAAIDLLLWLADADHQAEWTRAAQTLPPRAAALSAWGPERALAFAPAALVDAQLRPSSQVLSLVGPPLQRAVQDVLTGQAAPFDAAVLAAQAVNLP